MIAVDTNVLVYSHRSDSPYHKEADAALAGLAGSSDLWAIPWPCIHEFLAIVTHPRIYDPPTPQADALDQVECWLEVPTLVLLGEDKNHWSHLRFDLGRKRSSRTHGSRRKGCCSLQSAGCAGDLDGRPRFLAVQGYPGARSAAARAIESLNTIGSGRLRVVA